MSTTLNSLKQENCIAPPHSSEEAGWMAGITVLLFFLPKINLFSMNGETAGLRIDDVVLLIIACWLLFGVVVYGRRAMLPVEISGACYSFWCLLSNGLNIAIYSQSSVLYTIRFIEYFVFFYLGSLYAERHRIRPLAVWLLIANGAAIIFQSLHLIGGFSSEGFKPSLDRPIGLAGGPWEVGAIINFCLAVLIFDKTIKFRRVFAYFAITFGLLLVTGARIALFANFVLLILWMKKVLWKRKDKALWIVTTGLCVGIFFSALLLIPNKLTKRSEATFTKDNADYFIKLYGLIDPAKTSPSDLFEKLGRPDSADTDSSWLMRASKWAVATKLWIQTPTAWVFGVGPGTWGPALDGGWIRLITETGIVGFILFIQVFRRAVSSIASYGVVACLYVNMLMIDMHLAYKAMSFVLFAVGYYCAKSTSGDSKELVGQLVGDSVCF
jgi:uncharacterized protein with PQ loop repeat